MKKESCRQQKAIYKLYDGWCNERGKREECPSSIIASVLITKPSTNSMDGGKR